MKRGFDYNEYADWVKKLGIATKDFDTWLKEFMLDKGERVKSIAIEKQNAYTYVNAKGETKIGLIDTGNMIRSWYVGDVVVDGRDVYVTVGNPAEYASWIEYGHHLKGKHPFDGAYLLRTSIDEVRKQLPARFNKEFLQWLKDKGVIL